MEQQEKLDEELTKGVYVPEYGLGEPGGDASLIAKIMSMAPDELASMDDDWLDTQMVSTRAD